MLLSYLLFSPTRSDSVAGACLVGAGSLLASWLGEPVLSVRAGLPFVVAEDDSPCEYSSCSMLRIFWRWASILA